VLAATSAHASPLSFEVGLGGGYGWARRAGTYRDDNVVAIGVGVGLGRFVVLDTGLSEDLDRIEPALHLGVRVRPLEGRCWSSVWRPYVRADLAFVAASSFGSNYDALAGIGHWGRLSSHFAWFAELDGVARLGEVETLSLRLQLGIAVTTSSLWR
jgi:hypothetical protein